jgi:hypothetical protein
MSVGPLVVPVGGFLGAGKTTLILAAARLLLARGVKPAAILNDQGSELVDTRLAEASGVSAGQVTGACFCCRFSGLIGAIDAVRACAPDVIFAEAVGSCTDISATVLQPLKLDYAGQFRLAPYSVVVDPRCAAAPDADAGLSFLFEMQIAEADLICVNKCDLGVEANRWQAEAPAPQVGKVGQTLSSVNPAASPVRYLSALTGVGVAEWLDEVLAGEIPAGAEILDLDYERYARAEAALAWLNCRVTFHPATPLSPALVIGPLLDGLDAALAAGGLRIAHLKAMDDSSSGWLKASITRGGEEPVVEGTLDASPAAVHDVLLNARVSGDPAELRRIVEEQLRRLPGRVIPRTFECFSPPPPRPERRLSYVVKGRD